MHSRVWVPTLRALISLSRIIFIKVGRDTPSCLAAIVVVSSSGIALTVIVPPSAIARRILLMIADNSGGSGIDSPLGAVAVKLCRACGSASTTRRA